MQIQKAGKTCIVETGDDHTAQVLRQRGQVHVLQDRTRLDMDIALAAPAIGLVIGEMRAGRRIIGRHNQHDGRLFQPDIIG